MGARQAATRTHLPQLARDSPQRREHGGVVGVEELAVLGQRELEQLHPLEVLLRAERRGPREGRVDQLDRQPDGRAQRRQPRRLAERGASGVARSSQGWPRLCESAQIFDWASPSEA
jgi:hypothetical protein